MEREAVVKMFNKAFNDYLDAEKRVRTVCIDILKDICNRREDKTISLNNLKDNLDNNGCCYPTMAYNGGNHSEYASTMYSEVNGFRLEDDHIIFDIEDCSEYYVYDVMTEDLIGFCDILIEYENAGYIIGVSEYSADITRQHNSIKIIIIIIRIMATIYRVHYCPPNPGWNSRKLKQNRWFNKLDDLIAYLEQHPTTDLWVSHNGKKYVKFNINEVL